MSEKLNRTRSWCILKDSYRPKIRFWVPAAAVDEADLRLEIQNLCARGFGGVEEVVLSALSKEIACSEYGWGRDLWDKTVAIIADETQKCGMTMDIAIGPGWPIASPEITSVDDPAVL